MGRVACFIDAGYLDNVARNFLMNQEVLVGLIIKKLLRLCAVEGLYYERIITLAQLL